ncbi:hypothetical protein [Pseudorhodoplanes sinuspersici]|uniref:Uncharacterized protein n=1 Tax=Pseudorhodoplanes sinuspersici TaxID=1235591 RepID=A0A1W6ZLV8_9HYPH|nr:hypothetical protein [Pseudorhodoplanes sinuspersici]ARP98302.1 hypothetical protein CAK95_03770 [Pseudorhodoplanes sinuspersici]RKE65957.1 hypothetical protein DFP91_5529 [Pseudorhodoplanes sinuspersici]
MSTIALHQHADRGLTSPAAGKTARRWSLIASFALAFPLIFYWFLLAILVVKYGHLPNYVTPHDWIGNVLRIVKSTGSAADMVPIIIDEWLIEAGRINYDYGHGVVEWSFTIIPHKWGLVALAGALLGLNVALLLEQRIPATLAGKCIQASRFGLLTSLGSFCASVTNATVFSVVHCATPSWVGSLAVLGLDSYNLFAIEPFGPTISVLGLAALGISALLLLRDERSSDARARAAIPQEAVPC